MVSIYHYHIYHNIFYSFFPSTNHLVVFPSIISIYYNCYGCVCCSIMYIYLSKIYLYLSSFPSISIYLSIYLSIKYLYVDLSIGVRVRGLWAHDEGAGGALHPPQGAPPLLPRPHEVLRQAPLQVRQQQLRKPVAALQLGDEENR